MMSKLDEFFLEVILPDVLYDGNVDELSATEDVFCLCCQTRTKTQSNKNSMREMARIRTKVYQKNQQHYLGVRH